MMAFRLAPTPISRKGARRLPRVIPTAPGQRQPRERDAKHMACIALMPSVISGARPVEVCHVRYGEPDRGKSPTGMQEKPSDKWTLPLTAEEHRLADNAQHRSNERVWWERHGIDPIALCEELYAATGDLARMEAIIGKSAVFARTSRQFKGEAL